MGQKKRKTKQVKVEEGGKKTQLSHSTSYTPQLQNSNGGCSASTPQRDADVSRQISDISISESSDLFVQGACIAGLSLLLTYLGDVVFSNVLAVAEPLVAFRDPIVAALALGFLLHPTVDLLHASLSRFKWAMWIDDICDRSAYVGRRALSSAVVIWALFAVVSVLLAFLSIGLVKEGAVAARDAAALARKGEAMWREYIIEGGVLERYPMLEAAIEWFRLNVAASVLPRIDGAREEALSRGLEVFGNFSSDLRDVLELHGFEASTLPDPSALIGGGMSNVQDFIGHVLSAIWNICKSMTSSPEEAWAVIRHLWSQFSDILVQLKAMVETTQWMTSRGKDAAGAAVGFLRSSIGAFGSILSFLWRSFISTLLFTVTLFKLLQAEKPWLEVALANFLPGIVPVHSQEVLVKHVQTASRSLVASLGAKFGLMYITSYGIWLLFHLPFPYTISLVHALAHTFTPLSALGSGFVISFWSMYLIYETRGSRSYDSSALLRPFAEFVSDLVSGLIGLVGWQPMDGKLASYATWLTSPGVIYALAFAFSAFSALAWAIATAERYAPEMPWSKFITFGGVLVTVASWLSTRQIDEKGNTGAYCATGDESSASIVSPWALTVSLALYAAARVNPGAARAVLFGSQGPR